MILQAENWCLISSAKHPKKEVVIATALLFDDIHVFVGDLLPEGGVAWSPDEAVGRAMALVFADDPQPVSKADRRLAHAANDCMAGMSQLSLATLRGQNRGERSGKISLVSQGGGQLRVDVFAAAEALEWDIGDSARKSISLKIPDASLMFVALADEAFSALTLNGLGAWLEQRDIPHAWEADYYE